MTVMHSIPIVVVIVLARVQWLLLSPAVVDGWIPLPFAYLSQPHHGGGAIRHTQRPSDGMRRLLPDPQRQQRQCMTQLTAIAAASSTSMSSSRRNDFVYHPVLDFTNASTIDQMDRLDDAIMGGISTSSIRSMPNEPFARWSGVCRTDGGGFCGFRTNPFARPLRVGYADGFYVTCRLVSDTDADRRIWKMTTRSKPDRGELLYQAPFPLAESMRESNEESSTSGEGNPSWTTVHVPFASFRYVRGPRMIPDGPPLNTTGGLYQIGMTMSKFAFAERTTEIANFRDGFFELQIQDMGLYKRDERKVYGGIIQAITQPTVYTKRQAQWRRPVLLKMLSPLFKLLFSEQSQRRKSAMRLLREERNMSRGRAIMWGLKSRAAATGWMRSLVQTASILAMDSFRATLFTVVKLVLIYPLRLVGALMRLLTGKKAERNVE